MRSTLYSIWKRWARSTVRVLGEHWGCRPGISLSGLGDSPRPMCQLQLDTAWFRRSQAYSLDHRISTITPKLWRKAGTYNNNSYYEIQWLFWKAHATQHVVVTSRRANTNETKQKPYIFIMQLERIWFQFWIRGGRIMYYQIWFIVLWNYDLLQ